ncbi:histidine kinase [Halobacteriales archaeon QS_5_70_17]|nr:MAG: histidine kinase [Halobacteriales archaeon QS_5_70_17]
MSEAAPTSGVVTATVRVLYVDDDPEFAETTATVLERENERLDVRTVTDPRSAAELVSDRTDCVVSDYDMTGMNGLELLELVRERYPGIPFILFTSSGSEAVASEAISAGVTDYYRTSGGSEQYPVLANRIVEAGEKWRSERSLRVRENAITAFADAVSDPDPDFEEQLGEVLDIGREAFDTEHAALARVSDGDYRIVAARSPDEVEFGVGDVVPLEEMFCLPTVRDATTTQWGEVTAEAAESRADCLVHADEEVGFECYLGTPVYVRDSLYGTLYFISRTARRSFDPWEQSLLELMSRWIGGSLEEKHVRDDLQRQRDRMEQFASSVSHDLRNPLTVADGRLDLARRAIDDPDAASHLEEAATAVERATAIVDDLLELARDGNGAIDTEPTPLADVATDAWRSVDTASATMELDDRSIELDCDPARARRLLENLFHNAVEHGGNDPVVWLGPLPEGGGFYVEDDGPGVPEDDPEAIFEMGHSGDGGSGYGLAHVEQIATAHGWTVAATEGDRAGGARFEIVTDGVLRRL